MNIDVVIFDLVGWLVIVEAAAIALIRVEKPVDALEYMQLSENVYRIRSFSYDGITPTRDRQPLYPLFLVVFYWSLGQHPLIVKIVQALLGLATFLLILKIYLQITSERRLLLPSILIACYLPIWVNCVYLLTETLTIFWVTLGLYLLIRGIKSDSKVALLLGGGIFALGALTRPICISLLLLGAVFTVLFSRGGRRWLPQVSWYLVAALIVLLPWTIRNKVSTGSFTPLSSEGQAHLLFASGPDTQERREQYLAASAAERDSLVNNVNAYSSLAKGIASNPFGFAWRGVKRIFWVWTYFPGTRDYFGILLFRLSSYLAQLLLIGFAVFGLYHLERRERWLLLLAPVSFSLVLFFSGATSRFILPAMPAVIVGFAYGFVMLLRNTAKKMGIRARL